MRPHSSSLIIFLLLIAIGLAGSPSRTAAQTQQFGDKPYFLVARDDMSDPTFAHAVILMIPAPPRAAIIAGIIVNKPTKARLNQLFTNLPHLDHPDQTVFFGGPVEYDVPLLVTRGGRGAGSTKLMDHLYATGDLSAITSTLTHAWSPQDCRIFFGRSQWTPDQLRGEILRGAWDVATANLDLIFSLDPEKTWRSLVKESHERQVTFDPASPSDLRLRW